MKRILIADRQPIVQLGLRAAIRATDEFRLAAAVRNSRDVVAKAREVEADLLLMDPAAFGIDLSTVLDELGSLPWAPCVVAFTACEKEDVVLRVLAAGVRAYVLKDEEPEVLLSAMHGALSGQRWFSARIALKVIDRALDDFLTNAHPRAGKLAFLTAREREVLRLVGLGLSNREIAEALCVERSTAHGHVSKVVSKLQLPSRAAVIAFALRSGIVDLEKAESGSMGNVKAEHPPRSADGPLTAATRRPKPAPRTQRHRKRVAHPR